MCESLNEMICSKTLLHSRTTQLESFTQLTCSETHSLIHSAIPLLCVTKVTFKESLVTQQPYLQQLQAVISVMKDQVLFGEILKSQKLLATLIFQTSKKIWHEMSHKCCCSCSNSIKTYISSWTIQCAVHLSLEYNCLKNIFRFKTQYWQIWNIYHVNIQYMYWEIVI